MRLTLMAAATLTVLGMVLASCSTDNPVQPTYAGAALELMPDQPLTGSGSFTIKSKYSYVKSYPGGGGIFVLRLAPNGSLEGNVALSVEADPGLSAAVSTPVASADSPIFEITVSPADLIPLGIHFIILTASNLTHTETVTLQVDVIDWGLGNVELGQEKQQQFADWLEIEYPQLGTFSGQAWDIYATYPQILIVEHYTFLSEDWEFRVCFHVMIPPYDWSMMLLRPRGEWVATIAAIREWDENSGTYVIRKVPINDYPIMDVY
ncbi:MAG: hypothetical protein AB1483_00595 [Candidatus Zixiibacteriota bacterium]